MRFRDPAGALRVRGSGHRCRRRLRTDRRASGCGPASPRSRPRQWSGQPPQRAPRADAAGGPGRRPPRTAQGARPTARIGHRGPGRQRFGVGSRGRQGGGRRCRCRRGRRGRPRPAGAGGHPGPPRRCPLVGGAVTGPEPPASRHSPGHPGPGGPGD